MSEGQERGSNLSLEEVFQVNHRRKYIALKRRQMTPEDFDRWVIEHRERCPKHLARQVFVGYFPKG